MLHKFLTVSKLWPWLLLWFVNSAKDNCSPPSKLHAKHIHLQTRTQKILILEGEVFF